jgi:HEAT repeat protein
VGDRFRLIYLKSTDLEKSKRDESPSFCASEEVPGDGSPSSEFSMTADTFSTQAILKQAQADLEHPDPKARILAIRYLEHLDPSITLPLLQEVLFDKDPEVRIQALASLIKFKDSNILPLLKKSLRDKDPQVRLLALRGLFRMGEKIDLNILIQFLSDQSPWVRRRLATLLGWDQQEGVFPIIMELCKDVDARVRKAALFSLSTLYPEECENRLIEAMTDSDSDIRKWARRTLERMAAKPRRGDRASLSR